MTRTIQCRRCDARTEAANMADLLQAHTDDTGRFPCGECGTTDTYLRQRDPQAGRAVARWIRGALSIETRSGDPTVRPFVFLTADGPGGDVNGIEFKYYRSSRPAGRTPRQRGRPAGGPVLAPAQVLALAGRLAQIGIVSRDDWQALTRSAPRSRKAAP